MKLGRRVLGYLVRTRNYGLQYDGSLGGIVGGIRMERCPGESANPSGPVGAADSNHDVGPSLTAYAFILAGATVMWMCRLQKVAALSSTESEFYSLSSCVAMSIHVRNMMEELGASLSGPMQVLCDSRGARMLSLHIQSTARTRHIHRRWFFVSYYTRGKKVFLREVASKDNWSNILTKATGTFEFETDRFRMGIYEEK